MMTGEPIFPGPFLIRAPRLKGPIVRYLGWDDLPWRGSSQAGMRRRPRRPFPPHIPAHLATLPARTRPPPPARTTLNADMRPFRLRTFISSQQRRANADRCTLLPHPLTSLLTYPATYRDSSGFLASLAAHRTATTTGYAPPSRPSGCAFIPSIRSPHDTYLSSFTWYRCRCRYRYRCVYLVYGTTQCV